MIIPNKLKYQMQKDFVLPLSSNCCLKLKKEPIRKWEKENNRHVALTGMRNDEGGTRTMIKGCILTDKNGNLKKFHPLLKVDDEWENEFIKRENIELCKLYYPPYNFKRTGCAGCPFALTLQEQLTTMSKLLPHERKKCEVIWQPVYEEYRKLNYRLQQHEQLNLFDFNWED